MNSAHHAGRQSVLLIDVLLHIAPLKLDLLLEARMSWKSLWQLSDSTTASKSFGTSDQQASRSVIRDLISSLNIFPTCYASR